MKPLIRLGLLLALLFLLGCSSPVEPEFRCEWQWVRNTVPNTGIDSLEICVGFAR